MVIGGGSKVTASTNVGGSVALMDEGGIEGSYLEQEIIGRQPLLAEDDDEDQHQHLSSTQHLASMILPGNKGIGGSVMAGAPSTKSTPSTQVESLELSVLGGGPNSSTAAGDVFRRAPFLPSQQQQQPAFRLSSSSNHQRQHYQTQQRPVAAASATAAFVNTSFQGE